MPRLVRLALAGPALLLGCQASPDLPPAPSHHPVLAGRRLQAAERIEFLGNRDGQPYRLEVGALGLLRLVQPIRDTVAADAVARLARTFGEAALEVPADGSPALDTDSLARPQGFLEATFADGTVRVEIGGPVAGRDGQLVARVGARVGLVPATLLSSLQPEQARLRERALFERRETMDRVHLEWRTSAGPQSCVARRAGSIWRVEGPLPAAPLAAGDLADAVLGLRADDYRYAPLHGEPASPIRITVSGPHGRGELSLRRVDDRWVGVQAHRDLPVFVTLPGALRTLLADA